MPYLTKNSMLITMVWSIILSISSLSAESLYSCEYNGITSSYHENDARRLQSLGADCRIMSPLEEITCSMGGVRLNYSRSEAEDLLVRHPDATCQINDSLFLAITVRVKNKKPLSLKNKTVIYFPVNGNKLSSKNRAKVKTFAKQHRNMGYTYTITGYASATGSSAKNHTLSLKRAGIVRDTLLAGGINENNIISVDALGEESLRYNTKYEEGRNRAVVIKAFGISN